MRQGEQRSVNGPWRNWAALAYGVASLAAGALACTSGSSPSTSGRDADHGTGGSGAVDGAAAGGDSGGAEAGNVGHADGAQAGNGAQSGGGGAAAAGTGVAGAGGSGLSADGGTAGVGDAGGVGGADAGGATGGFLHPGLLHSDADFARMKTKVDAGTEPWLSGWQKLTANAHAQLTWTARPSAMVYRGADGTHPQNYAGLYNDAAAAYALAVRWKVSGDTRYADKAVEVLDAWSAVLVGIGGTSDKFLAAGIYGYEMANAAEIMRSYSGWPAQSFTRFKNMMMTVFYPMNHDFLVRHNGACISHYWANWDICNMDSIIAIGVLVDSRPIYDEAVGYFKTGAGNGAIDKAVVTIQPGNLGQWQESGRDQGHNALGIGLMGAFCEMAWKQGDDLYGYENNRFLAGAEYVAKYNLGNDVPYTPYNNCDNVNQTVISAVGREGDRPIWELVYNHYVNLRHVAAPYSTAYANRVRPEGGGGDYGPNSGGYDQLGYGTLTTTLDPTAP